MKQIPMNPHKNDTEALRASEAYLNMMIESAADYAFFAMDTDGIITRWNSGAQHIFGFTDDEIIGQHARILFIPEEQAAGIPEQELAHALETGYSKNERWHIRRSGARFFASGMVRPMKDSAGNISGFIKVARDITSRIEAEQERIDLLQREREARRAAEDANEARLQFVAMIAHELRNPLASIIGFATTLLADDVQFSPDEQRDFIETIIEEAEKLNGLIADLLDISRLHAGSLRIAKASETIDAILETAAPQLKTITAQHRFEIDIMPGLPPMLADRSRIAQVIVNLVQNAAKFSSPHTTITLRVHRVQAFVQFDISDEGIGVPPEHRQSIFEAFRQLENNSPHRGAGLGLAICRGLIEAHSGQIWIREQSRPGTTISFTLPVDTSLEP